MQKLYTSRRLPVFGVRALAVLVALALLHQLPLAAIADLPWAGHPALLVLGLAVALGSFGQAAKLAAATPSLTAVCSPLAHVFLLSASVFGWGAPVIVLVSFGPHALNPPLIGLSCTVASLAAGCLALDSWAQHCGGLPAPRSHRSRARAREDAASC